jgi:predicted nucleic acid-binding protein
MFGASPMRNESHELCAKYEAMFNRNELHYLAITKKTFEQATILRANFNIKTPDALHLSAAKIGKCDVFLTNDKQLEHTDIGITIEVLE